MKSNEAREVIIDNQMTYKDFAKFYNISITNTIKIFQYLDLRKCSKGQNCVNPNGPVQSRRNFHNNNSNCDGLTRQCIYCQKQYHRNNKEYFNQLNRQYRQNNKEYFNWLNQKYYQNNKEHLNQIHCQYRENNKQYFIQKRKKYNNSCAKFSAFNDQISYIEETRRDPNNLELLQVRCTYCNSWFNPINLQIENRIAALEGRYSLGTENRLYCSDECKQSCPIYYQQEHSKDDPRYYKNLGTSREVQSELRQLVFKRDNWTCQKCSTHKDNLDVGISLHCHHLEGIRWEPYESADVDMCLTVCSECHKEIHKIPGCTRQDMQCKTDKKG